MYLRHSDVFVKLIFWQWIKALHDFMLSYLLSMCVFLLYISDYWHADSLFSQRFCQSEQNTWIVVLAALVWPNGISPSIWSVSPCQFSFPFSHVSSPKTTFMTKHGLILSKWCFRTSAKPSDTSVIPQRWKQRRRRSPFCSHGIWIEETLRDETSQTSRKYSICKLLKGFLLLVWSEATGTGLHSQVPEQNRRDLSGLNRTQNRRSQTSVSVCRGVWIQVCFFTLGSWREAKLNIYILKLSVFTGSFNTNQNAMHYCTCGQRNTEFELFESIPHMQSCCFNTHQRTYSMAEMAYKCTISACSSEDYKSYSAS